MDKKKKSPPKKSESSTNSSNESKSSQKLIITLLILIIAILVGFIFQQQIKSTEVLNNKDLVNEELKKQIRNEIMLELSKNKSIDEEEPKIKKEQVSVEKIHIKQPKIEDKIVIEDKKLEDLSSAQLNFESGKTISLDSKKIKMKSEIPEQQSNTKKEINEKPKKQTNGKNTFPKEIENFPSIKISKMKTKKMWIPIPNTNGGHRRVPPIEIQFGKEHGSSVKVWLFEEFLSQEESEHLIKAHESHLKELLKQKPIICFDSISTLKKNLIELKRELVAEIITPNDFTTGTTCLNQTFSRQLEKWGLKWSFSTAFYPGESKFSKIFGKRIEEATMLNETHGGKFQITSYPPGVGYKDHTDCVIGSNDQRDRYATFLVYLNELGADGGGQTVFTELGIDVKPRQGRALTWNNMNYEDGKCEAKSIHRAMPVQHEVKKKYIIQRWYYYKNFYALGKRMSEAELPEREPNTPKVSCDNYDNGSCRMYDEWSPDHMIDYQREKKNY